MYYYTIYVLPLFTFSGILIPSSDTLGKTFAVSQFFSCDTFGNIKQTLADIMVIIFDSITSSTPTYLEVKGWVASKITQGRRQKHPRTHLSLFGQGGLIRVAHDIGQILPQRLNCLYFNYYYYYIIRDEFIIFNVFSFQMKFSIHFQLKILPLDPNTAGSRLYQHFHSQQVQLEKKELLKTKDLQFHNIFQFKHVSVSKFS